MNPCIDALHYIYLYWNYISQYTWISTYRMDILRRRKLNWKMEPLILNANFQDVGKSSTTELPG